jgi:hypothetical protein
MRQLSKREISLLLLVMVVASARRSSSGRSAPWSPMGPFPEDNSVPVQPTIPPNPLDKSGKP